MSIYVSRLIVRFAAAVTVLACGCCVTYLAAGIYGEMLRQPRIHINVIVFIGLWSVLPILFIWESVRAWRFLPKSIESLSIIWALSGLAGVSYGLMLGFVDGWRIRNVIEIVVGLFVFLCGLWMTKQQRRLYDAA